MKIKKDDQVVIISGKYRGKKGKILRVLPEKEKVAVEGINIVKKNVRSRKSGEKGQIVDMPSPLSVSNVKLICPQCGKAVRVGFKMVGEKKYRICKKCGKEI
jgi:large subunit ribosomal protein L24